MSARADPDRQVFAEKRGEMVGEVVLHLIEVDAFQVASGHDAGRKRERGAVLQKINKIILAGQD